MLRVKRSTGISGALGRIKIYINDEQVAAIKRHEQIELELPTNEAKITVSQAGVHSNELLVKEGQVVEITKSSQHRIGSILLLLALILISFLLPFDYRIYAYLVVLVVAVTVDYYIEGFELKVIYP